QLAKEHSANAARPGPAGSDGVSLPSNASAMAHEARDHRRSSFGAPVAKSISGFTLMAQVLWSFLQRIFGRGSECRAGRKSDGLRRADTFCRRRKSGPI